MPPAAEPQHIVAGTASRGSDAASLEAILGHRCRRGQGCRSRLTLLAGRGRGSAAAVVWNRDSALKKPPPASASSSGACPCSTP